MDFDNEELAWSTTTADDVTKQQRHTHTDTYEFKQQNAQANIPISGR